MEPKKNVLSQHSGHIYRGRKNVRLKDVIAFVEKRFDQCKKGTKFEDLVREFGISKSRAQRILKRGTQKGFLFTPRHTNPQTFYSETRHYAVIEHLNNEENVLEHTTGTRHSKSPISNCLEHQKAKNFLDILTKLPFMPLLMHKIVLELVLDTDGYNLINANPWKRNLGKSETERIDNTEVNCVYYKNGKLVIYIGCRNRPFKIETEEDLAILYSFFGQVRDRLEYQNSDPRGRLVPNITRWILKQCEFNKDVPITDEAQLTVPDIQLTTAFQTFRLYVKNLEGKAYCRAETLVQINQELPTYLASIIIPNGEILSSLDTISKQIKALSEKIDLSFAQKP